jgi:hypothetical protein
MDDELYNHFLGKLTFAQTTRLRVAHNGNGNDDAIVRGNWLGDDGIRQYKNKFVSYFEFFVTEDCVSISYVTSLRSSANSDSPTRAIIVALI